AAARSGGKSHRGGRAGRAGAGRRGDADQRDLCRLRLLHPVRRRLLLRLPRVQSAAAAARALADRSDHHPRGATASHHCRPVRPGIVNPKEILPTGRPMARGFVERVIRHGALAAMLIAGSMAGAADPAGGIAEYPLAPRSGPRGATMFKVMSPQETGVITENRYADPNMWGKLYNEFDVGSIGTGVAIGDYDNDGRPDIFVVSKTESCRLFRNLGNWKFEDVTEKAGVGDQGEAARIWKQGATFVDVNNDGLLDIYVCRFNAPNLLYINQGDGTFKEKAHAYGLDVNDAIVMAYFYDYDRDGWLDVFIQTNVLDAAAHPEGQRSYLFHNNRNGTFTNVTDRAGVAPGRAHGNSAVWWDFDGDGWPGLYVANDFDVPDALYRNNRDGTFTDVIAHVVPH